MLIFLRDAVFRIALLVILKYCIFEKMTPQFA
jgi:hypothetical protein